MRVRTCVRSSAIVAVVAMGTALTSGRASGAYAFSTLASFTAATGARPVGNLVLSNGNLYGVTNRSGTGTGAAGSLYGYSLSSNTLNIVTTFTGANGANPAAGLTVGVGGNLFGTTSGGGTGSSGTVFQLNSSTNVVTTLASFPATGTLGKFPASTAISDAAGNVYGTAAQGGANNSGTVFKVMAGTNTLSTIADFTNANGASPAGGLVADAAGNFYGTTQGGGSGGGNGTVYKVAAGTNALTTIGTFTGTGGAGNQGAFPQDSLTRDAAGNLYGITNRGGTNNTGTIFKIDAATGTLTTLLSFDPQAGTSGFYPAGALTLDAQGNLYGTTTGDPFGSTSLSTVFGTVFKLDTATNAFSVLATFTGGSGSTPGLAPQGGLLIDANGNIYGTTNRGGAAGTGASSGSLFVLAVPEPASLAILFSGTVMLVRRRNNA